MVRTYRRWGGSFDKILLGGAPGAGAIGLDIEIDGKTLQGLKLLKSVSRDYAAKALNEVARESVPKWREANHRTFYMRRSWIDRGVRVRLATPGNLVAQVGTIDKYMGRHVVGIGEQKVSAGRGLFVPVYENISQVGTHDQIRRMLARARGTSRKPFRIKTHSGNVMIVRRRGRARDRLELLGVIKRSVHIEPHLDAQRVVSDVVNRRFGPVYESRRKSTTTT